MRCNLCAVRILFITERTSGGMDGRTDGRTNGGMYKEKKEGILSMNE